MKLFKILWHHHQGKKNNSIYVKDTYENKMKLYIKSSWYIFGTQ